MLERDISIENLRLIIAQVEGSMVNRQIFENALYDCFEYEEEVKILMAGYEFFSKIIEKPRFDNAVAILYKGSKITRDYAKLCSEIWIEAKFNYFSPEQIARTLKERDSYGYLYDTPKETHTEAQENKTVTLINDDKHSTAKKVTDKNKTQISYGSADKKIPAKKWYAKLSGRHTVIENCYSSGEKFLIALMILVGIVVPTIISFYTIDVKIIDAIFYVNILSYIVIGTLLYVLYLKDKNVRQPLKMSVITNLIVTFSMLASYIVLSYISHLSLPNYYLVSHFIYAFSLAASIVFIYNLRGKEKLFVRCMESLFLGIVFICVSLSILLLLIKLYLYLTGSAQSLGISLIVIFLVLYSAYLGFKFAFKKKKIEFKHMAKLSLIMLISSVVIILMSYASTFYIKDLINLDSVILTLFIALALFIFMQCTFSLKYLQKTLIFLISYCVLSMLGGVVYLLFINIFISNNTVALIISCLLMGLVVYSYDLALIKFISKILGADALVGKTKHNYLLNQRLTTHVNDTNDQKFGHSAYSNSRDEYDKIAKDFFDLN